MIDIKNAYVSFNKITDLYKDLEDEIIQKSVGRELQSMFRHSRGLCRRIVSEKMFYRHKVECYLQKG